MKIITTISPSHNSFSSQIRALKSWLNLGFRVYSINHQSEIKTLKQKFNHVNFIQADKTMHHVFGRHLIPLDVMLDFAQIECDDIICLINSDIEITDNRKKIYSLFKKADRGICLVSRYNYDEDINKNSIEKFGLDMFCFHKKFAKLIPKSNMTIGKPLWDYWIPYHLSMYGIPIYSIHDRICFHKSHKLQWSKEDWKALSQEFRRYDNFKKLTNKQLSPAIRTAIISGIKETIQEL